MLVLSSAGVMAGSKVADSLRESAMGCQLSKTLTRQGGCGMVCGGEDWSGWKVIWALAERVPHFGNADTDRHANALSRDCRGCIGGNARTGLRYGRGDRSHRLPRICLYGRGCG